ncbi:MAG: magnesium-translocating P-type ATPase [Acetobacter aceti]|uniref:Magnesium-transporting ATPase, P-type 1 n=1 Tax=Acetobacter aceti TaxID=435 RepID=A0A1U9KDL9_ACEAC|nr:magnesium-translocating P-type ATPase [Acetobacter aceti]AQS83829.1 magnesium-translocating P-type ATPase [Acetobacter aceti]
MNSFETVLRTLFSLFLTRRHTHRYFRRQAILESLNRLGTEERPASLRYESRKMRQVATDDVPAVLSRMDSSPEGLTSAQVESRRAQFGPNEVEHEKPLPAWRHLGRCYGNPFNLLLTALALISALTHDMKATVVIGTMVVLSTLIRFVQEGRSNRAAERLKAMVSNTATVIRRQVSDAAAVVGAGSDGARCCGEHLDTTQSAEPVELPISDLVPGDHVILSAGDMIPADCRVLTARDLFVSQGAMTGESLPVEKFSEIDRPFTSVFETPNLVFMGTNVVSGSATALVVATGPRTCFGTLSARVTASDRTPTAFEAGVNSVSWLLIRFALVMAPVVLLINGLTKGDWVDASLFALSVAVGLTPEMLPMIVTSTLARGAVTLSRRKVIVKRLDAIQNFGAMDILCTDKTGTITQDRIALARHTDVFGAPSGDVLRYAWLNSFHQTGLRNLLDRAVLEHVALDHDAPDAQDWRKQEWRKIDEIPFDFERRRMSVIVAEGDNPPLLICKGAVEEMLAACTWVSDGESTGALPLDAAMLVRLRAVTQDLNRQGLRVVAVAVREMPSAQSVYSVKDEAGLMLVGYIAFLDPPKETTAPALNALAAHGVEVKVLTGDSELVTAQVCAQVGFGHARFLTGPQIEKMSDAVLAHAVSKHRIFARLTPQHKERIVRALRDGGHVVGFLGDGINDAAALRAADIGISVDTGVDIAKEAADIILLEKSLMVLEEGVLEGRRTFCNMLKYIRMTASSNFGNVFSVLVGSAFLPFLPMLPLQLLVQNLLYDLSQTAIPFDRVDRGLIARPLKWNPRDLGRFMLFFGPVSSVFDIATFVLMWHVFGANSVARQSLFQSGWFVEGLLTQTLIVHMIRTPERPFIDSRAAWPLMLMTVLIAAIGIALPLSPLAGYFGLQALPLGYYPWLAGMIMGYAVLTTVMKKLYIRRFGW